MNWAYYRPYRRTHLWLRAVEQVIDYRDKVFINFRDFTFGDHSGHGYRWVDLKRFGLLSPSADDTALLDALIKHDQFRDDYAGGGVDPQGTRHGSYWLNQITTQAYEPVDEPTSIAVLTTWASQHGDVPERLEHTL